MIPFPRTVIHPQFHPLEPEWIEFSGDPAPRMHRVRRDGTGLECLYEHGNDEFIVHETFLGAHRRPGVHRLAARALPYGLDHARDAHDRRITTPGTSRPIAPGAAVLCDTNHPDEGLQIIDAATGARRQVCLSGVEQPGHAVGKSRYALAEDFARRAIPSAGWKMPSIRSTVRSTPTRIPVGAATNLRVAFASDRTGVTQVYVVSV